MADEVVELAVEVIGEIVDGAADVAAGSRSGRSGCRKFLAILLFVVAALGVLIYFLL
jgi:hypothetical protein